jgi:hypothetical protein
MSGISLIKIFPGKPFFGPSGRRISPDPAPGLLRVRFAFSSLILRKFFESSRRISEAHPKDSRRKSGKISNLYRSGPGTMPFQGTGNRKAKKAGKQEIFIRLIPDSYIRALNGPIFAEPGAFKMLPFESAGTLRWDPDEIVIHMIKEYVNIFIFKKEILRRYLKIFLIYLTGQFDERFRRITQTGNHELVQKFMNALGSNYHDKRMVADYAMMLYITPHYLNEIVKKVVACYASAFGRSRHDG